MKGKLLGKISFGSKRTSRVRPREPFLPLLPLNVFLSLTISLPAAGFRFPPHLSLQAYEVSSLSFPPLFRGNVKYPLKGSRKIGSASVTRQPGNLSDALAGFFQLYAGHQ